MNPPTAIPATPASTAEHAVAQLRATYRPVAVILHGSRSVTFERAHSDWDMVLLFNAKPPLAARREEIAEQDVEWSAVQLPVADDTLLETVGLELQFGKVMWEDGSKAGSHLLEQAASLYRKGVQLSEEQKRTYRQFLTHKVSGMEDDLGTPYLFLRHQYIFFLRATNWWFEMHGEFSKPFYLALPEIRERDQQYHDLLMTVSSSGPGQTTVVAGRRIIDRLFA